MGFKILIKLIKLSNIWHNSYLNHAEAKDEDEAEAEVEVEDNSGRESCQFIRIYSGGSKYFPVTGSIDIFLLRPGLHLVSLSIASKYPIIIPFFFKLSIA